MKNCGNVRRPDCDNIMNLNQLCNTRDKRCEVPHGHPDDKKKKALRNKGWGLRQFSTLVCNKVKAKGRTTYNEVADEITRDMSALQERSGVYMFDEKNIRRRVYDAFNVLLAINVIAKVKKEIKWVGFPSTSNEDFIKIKGERMSLLDKIQTKANFLQDLEHKYADLNNLILRNQLMHRSADTSGGITLPFLLVRTNPRATVEIEISEDRRFVNFDFNGTPFTLHDAEAILKEMNCAGVGIEKANQNTASGSNSCSKQDAQPCK